MKKILYIAFFIFTMNTFLFSQQQGAEKLLQEDVSPQNTVAPSESSPSPAREPASPPAREQVERQAPQQVQRNAPTQKRDALALYKRGEYASAISVCTSELVQNPFNVESFVVMCWALVANGQYAEAEQRASDGLKIAPNDLRLIEVFGEAKYYLGKNNGALEQFQRYVAKAPQGASRIGTAYYFMGEIYIRQARYQHADIALSFAVRNEPNFDAWWTQLGYAREMAGNLNEAVAAYDEALKLNEGATQAMDGKARITNRR